MKKTLVVTVFATSLLLTSCLVAQEKPFKLSTVRSQMKDVRTETVYGNIGTKTASARPPLKSDSFVDLFADVLYWHASENGTDWAGKGLIDPVTEALNFQNEKVSFGWDPGFRVGAGYNFAHDGWDGQIYYTWFHTARSESTSLTAAQLETSILTSEIVPPIGNFSAGKIHWRIHFSSLDVEMGRNYFVSKWLSLRPHFGLKGAIINQNIKGFFVIKKEPGNLDYHSKNEFIGGGPSAGLNSQWFVAGSKTQLFSLFGDIAGAWMYGHFHVKESEVFPKGAFTLTGFNQNLGVPMIQVVLGIAWDITPKSRSFHCGIKLGYEVQHWFNQNQMVMIYFSGIGDDASLGASRFNGDLDLQGLTGQVRFDF